MRRSLSMLLLAALSASCSSQGSKPVAKVEPASLGAPRPVHSARMRTDPAAIRTAVAENPADAAWRLFLELNDPVTGPGSKVWETEYRQTSTVYLSDGGVPPPWGEVPPPPDLPPVPSNGCVPPGVRHNLDTIIQVDGRDLLDKWRQPVRYQLLMNQPVFDYIVDRQFYNVNGQERAAQQGQPADFPATSFELKTSWLWLGTDAAKCAEVAGKYYVVNAYYQVFDRDGQPAGWAVGYAALAGMHIINKSMPKWVWITFENVFDSQFTAAHLELPITPEDQAANRSHQDALSSQGSVFANYQLDGVQTTFTVPNNPNQPTLLANSTIESAFQTQSSCITCHHLASIKPNGEYFNLAYTQGGNVNYYVGDPPSLAGYNFLDYVWSMKRAHRERTAAVPPNRTQSKEVSQ